MLRSLVTHEEVVSAKDGRWFVVRILPYRTLENVIDGVVITFNDATASKKMEQALREQANQLRQMTNALPNLIWSFRPDGACDYVGPQWEKYTGTPTADQVGYAWIELLRIRIDRERSPRRVGRQRPEVGKRVQHRISHSRPKWRLIGGSSRVHCPSVTSRAAIVKWYGSSTDIHALKTSTQFEVNGGRKRACESAREGPVGVRGSWRRAGDGRSIMAQGVRDPVPLASSGDRHAGAPRAAKSHGTRTASSGSGSSKRTQAARSAGG